MGNESTAMKLAENIGKMAESLSTLKDSPFNRKLLVLYIHDSTKLGKQQINAVLDALEAFTDEFGEEE
ncbi:hypothetical protein [Methanobacterium formicicum]|uniref:hypothetical protein n=1 Tax=Methanobacterium formicicum TaxID=2162 RepID=UPI002412C4A1|nr:hypothetical protein [Methanobacterium formicicum]MDG3546583.1 hypothetical protein [Methanobacterium formicicum]